MSKVTAFEFHFGGDRYTVEVDTYAWEVRKHGVNKKTGEPTSTALHWHSRVETLADWMAQQAIISQEAGDMVAAVRSVADMLEGLLGGRSHSKVYPERYGPK